MNSEEKTEKSPTSELLEQAIRYFKKAGYKIEHEATALEGFCGVSRKFDLIVQKGRASHGVWVRDWKDNRH